MAVTTFAGGSGSWRKTDWTPLAGKEVSIWADADDDAPPDKPKAKSRPGQTAAMEIAAHLHEPRLPCSGSAAGAGRRRGHCRLASGWEGPRQGVLAGLLRDYEPEPVSYL